MRSRSRNDATASMRPLPQSPAGSTSPMTWKRISPFSSHTLSMAPGAPRMPKVIFAPSSAGPAAVEQAAMRPFARNTISPLVPMSTRRTLSSAESSFVASTAPTVSAPTYPAMSGTTNSVAFSQVGRKSFAVTSFVSVSTGSKGTAAKFFGSSPRNSCCMAGFPTRETTPMSAGERSAFSQSILTSASTPSVMSRCRSSREPSMAAWMREMTSAP